MFSDRLLHRLRIIDNLGDEIADGEEPHIETLMTTNAERRSRVNSNNSNFVQMPLTNFISRSVEPRNSAAAPQRRPVESQMETMRMLEQLSEMLSTNRRPTGELPPSSYDYLIALADVERNLTNNEHDELPNLGSNGNRQATLRFGGRE